jgi:hypothetical protein
MPQGVIGQDSPPGHEHERGRLLLRECEVELFTLAPP